MLGNFFRLTCPYVYDMESLAYFPLLRNRHSFHAIDARSRRRRRSSWTFTGTAAQTYLYPTKVEHRYSPTMYMLHAWEGESSRR